MARKYYTWIEQADGKTFIADFMNKREANYYPQRMEKIYNQKVKLGKRASAKEFHQRMDKYRIWG